jgi:hypothetical protein
MMPRPDRLYDLLPVIYRMRDAGEGYPLRDFLRVLGTQADVIEADIARLYDNWFIETCDDWVVPYIGDLLGYRLLPQAQTLAGRGADAARLGQVLAPRRDVAKTIASRRRKGTLSLLEDLARDAGGWPARAVEFFRLLGWMQHLDHRHPHRGGTLDLRRPGPLGLLGSAFDSSARSVDVRGLGGSRSRGRYNIPSTGLFVFRLCSYSVTKTAAQCYEERGPHCFNFSVLGNDTALSQRVEEEATPAHIAEERNLPVPIRRHRFAERGPKADYKHVSPDLYGEGKSVLIWAPDWPKKGEGMPVSRDAVLPADLSGWRYRVPRGRVAVDPELGRMVFPTDQRPRSGVWVSYQYRFAADIGGGEYPRPIVELDGATRYVVHAPPVGNAPPQPLPDGHFASISDALLAWGKAKTGSQGKLHALIIELAESGVYEGRMDIALEQGEAIQIRAAQRTRPILRLLDYRVNQADAIAISGRRGSRFVLDGVMILGGGIEVSGPTGDDAGRQQQDDDLCEVVIRHCTLVPGWTLHCSCDPRRPGEPSIRLSGTRATVRIECSIVGAIATTRPANISEPSRLIVCDSIIDATDASKTAVGSADEAVAGVEARFERSTIIGEMQVHSIALAQDSIFAGHVRVMRRQTGCMRFCYAPFGSRTPHRFHCQPDLIYDAAGRITDPEERARKRAAELLRVVPQLMSLRYGTADYARLADTCCPEIRTGASDEAAMGVFHDLYEPQREVGLNARLQDSVPAGTDAGLIFAS